MVSAKVAGCGVSMPTAVAATGVAGLALAGVAMPDARIAYPPLDTPKPLAPGLWTVDAGPIRASGLRLPIRMTVVQLPDGGLLLHSPTPFTPALGAALAAIGPVRHLVAPSYAHWSFLADWQRVCLAAQTWMVPALRHRATVRRAPVRLGSDLTDGAPDAWGGVLDVGLLGRERGFQEAWFFHRESRTLLLADLIENLRPTKLPPMSALLMAAAGGTRGTTALHVRAALRRSEPALRRKLAALVALAPERVVFAHGTIFAADAAARLRRGLAWATG